MLFPSTGLGGILLLIWVQEGKRSGGGEDA